MIEDMRVEITAIMMATFFTTGLLLAMSLNRPDGNEDEPHACYVVQHPDSLEESS